jgi:hypothetical protein
MCTTEANFSDCEECMENFVNVTPDQGYRYCYPACPTGYNGTCRPQTDTVLSYTFDKVDVSTLENSGIGSAGFRVVTAGNNPVPAAMRGFYFNGETNGFIELT